MSSRAAAPLALASPVAGSQRGRPALREASGDQRSLPAPSAAPECFAAYAAHELRAPVALQRTLVEVALADPHADTEALRAMGKRVIASCEQQQRLLAALLDLTRSRWGLSRREPVDLAATVADALRTHDPGELESDVRLERAGMTGDPDLLMRLAENLVSNAIRHNTLGGRIELATRSESGRAVLSVANTGPLIAAGELQRLFQPFHRAVSGPTGAVEGVGLGLAIVHAIADAHNARISARALAGGGLEIKISFPPILTRAATPGTASGRARCGTTREPDRTPTAARSAGHGSPASGHRHRLPIALAAIGCAVAIAACGSSNRNASSGSPTAGQGKLAGALAFAKCMRAHAVPDFPDPKVSGNSIQILGSSPGIDRQSPAFVAAQHACEHLLPAGAAPSQQQTARLKARFLTLARCMRAHGIPGFPDPTSSPPASRAGYSAITSNGGAWLAIPGSIDVTSPAFHRAASACKLGTSL